MGNSYGKSSTAEELLTDREEESCGFFKQSLSHSLIVIAKIRSPQQMIDDRTLVVWLHEITVTVGSCI
ncbi:hypothetical protein [Microcoleus sp. B3-D7]|uniref:hypothetical protein n=1 Tax=Microcoleus sp. B3-D7 TaxID=2818659 RepID=UPI002FD054E7